MKNKIKKKLISLIPFSKIRRKIREKYRKNMMEYANSNLKLDFSNNPKCLILAPHPDDELISCGGILCKYPELFDVVCLASSGQAMKNLTAKERSQQRINDFNKIMDEIGVNKHIIYEYVNPNNDCYKFYKENIDEYCKAINLKDYKYIFLPHEKDGHYDHQYVIKLLKLMSKKQKIKENNIILAFYEVWSPVENPNTFIIIDDIIDKKIELLKKYQIVGEIYAEPTKALNRYRAMQMTANRNKYVEVFRLENLCKKQK